MALASLISVCVFPLARNFFTPQGEYWRFIAGHLAMLWAMALFVYGVALATMRMRFWLPMIAVIAIGWLIGTFWLFAQVVERWRPFNIHRADPLYVILVFAMFSAYVGAVLAYLAYRR
jgi:hypothetical protein